MTFTPEPSAPVKPSKSDRAVAVSFVIVIIAVGTLFTFSLYANQIVQAVIAGAAVAAVGVRIYREWIELSLEEPHSLGSLKETTTFVLKVLANMAAWIAIAVAALVAFWLVVLPK